VYKC